MAESYSVKAILSADVSKWNSAFSSANSAMDTITAKASSGLGFGILAGIGAQAFSAISSGLKNMASGVVEAGSTFDASMSQVSALSGATGAELEALADKAKEMGSSTKFSASEAADAMSYMGMAGWKSKDMLEGLDGIMNLAAASGADLATTSDIVTDALTAFGKSASDSSELANIMAAACANSNTSVELMGETFKYAAPIAGTLGYTMEDTALAIGLMANAGIKGSQAGTALRSTMTRISTNTSGAKDAIENLGIATTNTDGTMRDLSDMLYDLRGAMSGMTDEEKTMTAKTIAGQEAMAGLLAIVNASDDDWDKLSEAIATSSNDMGKAKEMADTMQDNFEGDVTKMQSAWEGFSISLWEKIKEPARGVVQEITDMIGKAQSIVENSDIVSSMVGALESAISTINSFASQIGDIFSAVKGGYESSGIDGAIDGLFGKLEGLMPVITGIGSLFAANFVIKNAGSILSTADNIGSAFGSAFGSIKSAAGSVASKVNGLSFSGFLDKGLNGAAGVESAFQKLGSKIPGIGGKISSLGTSISNSMLGGLDSVESLHNKIGGLLAPVQKVAGPIVSTVGSVSSSALGILNQMMSSALAILAPAAIIAVVVTALGAIYSAFGEL